MLLRRMVRQPGGGVRVTLPVAERQLLADLAATLRSRISDVDPDVPFDAITARLFPRAYEDPLDQMQYAGSMMGPLAEAKRTQLDTFAESLVAGEVSGGTWRHVLTPDDCAAWMAVLQDGRLVLATAVGIETEEDWEELAASEDEVAIILDHLGMLLNTLVMLLMGDVTDE